MSICSASNSNSHTGVGVAAGSDQHGALAFVKDAMHISKAFSSMHESSLSFVNTSSKMQVVLIKSFRCWGVLTEST